MKPCDERLAAWARSGAMALTGRPCGPPLGPPTGLVERMWALQQSLADCSGRVGRRVDVDGLALLGERAALAGWRRAGDRSCGGATRLLPAGAGWLAVTLARPSDLELLPAWLGCDERRTDPDPWAVVASAVRDGNAPAIAADAQLLGLPVAALPSGPSPNSAAPVTDAVHAGLPLNATALGSTAPTAMEDLLVVDLSSLWAGPLCAQLLGDAGARIVKVESTGRPDGARLGPPAFFDLLHAGHESVAVDFTTPQGREQLCRLVHEADVVIEGSRPRALRQLGLDAEAVIDEGRPRVWVSITGYGRDGDAAQKVAFGDDAAVAGGLVVWDGDGPCFCADAIADPTTGLVAATAVLASVASGSRWLLDISLREVAAHLVAGAQYGELAPEAEADRAGATGTAGTAGNDTDRPLPTGEDPMTVAAPRARPTVRGVAPLLGAHSEAVFAELRRPRP